MRVGFVLECQGDGADVQICRWIAKEVCPALVLADGCFSTLSNKRVLMEQCGEEAKKLLAAGCEHVFVVWDLRPAWPNDAEELDCAREVEIVKAQLRAARVPHGRTCLLCITHEIEAWLLADPEAIRAFCSRPTHQAKHVPSQGRVEHIAWPKSRVEELCDQRGRRFIASTGALAILKGARKARLRSVPSYARFEDKIAALCAKALGRAR